MIDEKELEKREKDLETKETDLTDKAGKLDAREKNVEIKEKEIKEQPGFFHDLPEGQAVELGNKWKGGDEKARDSLIELATARLMAELKLVGIEDLPQFESKGDDKLNPETDARFKELEKDKEATKIALKAAIDQLQSVNTELETEKVEAKLNELGITPANRELLKGILLAKKGDTIKLTEKEGEKDVKKEYTVAEAVIKLISGDKPFKIEPGQQSILSPKPSASVKLREGLKKVLDMSDKEWEDLPEHQRNFFLKKLGGGK